MKYNHTITCPLCGTATPQQHLQQTGWAAPEVVQKLVDIHPNWRRENGACPACVQQALLITLLEKGDAALHESIQAAWPLDAEAAFGALPTPLRMHADPRFTGKDVTVAIVDSGFFPHPDLIEPQNRIRVWVDASKPEISVLEFASKQNPTWPGWDEAANRQWHGTMTSTVMAGNGWLGHGLYRGMASEANLVLIQVLNGIGHIDNERIARALSWIRENAEKYKIQVVNLSLGGDWVEPLAENIVDQEVAVLIEKGISVVVAAGNNGERRLVPPATAPHALTIGGLDDNNTFAHDDIAVWHSNYGETAFGALKPELVAPSIWLAAPILPGTDIAHEAVDLFERRKTGDKSVEPRIGELKLVTPYYQHVDGTSFAAPIVTSVIACMLQANPLLTSVMIRNVLLRATHKIPGVSTERQGAGTLDAGQAVSLALREWHSRRNVLPPSPHVNNGAIEFLLHDHDAENVQVVGSWDKWHLPGLVAQSLEDGVWQAKLPLLPQARYTYKFLLNGSRWLDDPENPVKAPDGFGGLNSVLVVK